MATGKPGIFWAAHQVGLPYSQIERLANLDQLPPNGFTVACFPLRLVGASAAPARVVAILDDRDHGAPDRQLRARRRQSRRYRGTAARG